MNKSAKRGRSGAKRLDTSDLRKLFEDRRAWLVLARVEIHEGETSHFEFVTNQTGQREVYVDVVTIPSEIELSCKLSGDGGIWRIPALGSQVYVGIPDGQIDFVPGIVSVVGERGDGLSESISVIALPENGRLHVHTGDNGAVERVMLMSDYDRLAAYIDKQFDPVTGHTHMYIPGSNTPVATTTIAEGSAGAGVTTVPAAVGSAAFRTK